LRGVLGNTEMLAAQGWIDAWSAASWDRVAALTDDREEKAEAKLAALATVANDDPTRSSPAAAREIVRRAEDWLAQFGDAEGADVVRLRHAEASVAMRRQSQDEGERESAQELFEQDLLLLAATTPPGEALEGALVRLIGFNADELDKAELLYTKLIDSAEDPEATRAKMRGGYSTRGIAYKIEGLPTFEMTTTDGVRMTGTELPGRVTLLDFWATWCGPCRAELPNLKKAYEQYHDEGFDIVGISLDNEGDKDQQAFLAWCEENGMPWPQVYDGKGWSARLAGEFGVRAIPFALLVDDEGTVLAVDDELRGESLLEVVGEALSPAAPALGGQ
jgi:thiol-disulfide isomerase/thioredoxin